MKIAPLGVVPPEGDFIWPNASPGAPIPAATTATTNAVDHRMTVLPFRFVIVSYLAIRPSSARRDGALTLRGFSWISHRRLISPRYAGR
ncbi:MAG: hypothetical protein DMD94_20170 [Candidatus Rokuibacteriota bacterium]|nr:MAG: hypothetical protein DMD94_20170 [Candidatus Rokubacteria bacterium]